MRTTILHADADADIRALAEIALGLDPGFRVTSVASGTEALCKLAFMRPELILLDAYMPQMDGAETLRQLRKLSHLRDTQVAFMAARSRRQDYAHFLDLGACAIIEKPFDPLTLAKSVRELIDGPQRRTG